MWTRRWAPYKDFIKAVQMLSRPLLVLTIVEALTDQSESKQEAPGGTASNASSESQSEPQTDSFSIRHQMQLGTHNRRLLVLFGSSMMLDHQPLTQRPILL
ncbi:uncharacterized protein LOC130510729 isoform X1 [Raphanus sativus]|uniref:Uncharacterized protein LOC130510729 isoform X1 n=1 Tax=Raphanus sativus TaxID=3726 RepID=A0A9W3DHB7_RAPSA|nr:uncharacterized protein LOC130510729 isoform X1 [Raphanus sativus]